MAITLGAVSFDEAHTRVRDKVEEVGGRDERRIDITGMIIGESAISAIEARLDAILDAASAEDYGAELSFRQGRRLWVRREAFVREIAPESLVGSFTLTVAAKEPFEESTTMTTVNWTITASGQTKGVTAGGNLYAKPRLTLVATGSVINPSFSDGTRTMAYSGTVANGSTLVFDGPAGKVTLDGTEVTPYCTGEFPRIAPEGTTLTYTDDAASSHTAAVTITYRDRWW